MSWIFSNQVYFCWSKTRKTIKFTNEFSWNNEIRHVKNNNDVNWSELIRQIDKTDRYQVWLFWFHEIYEKPNIISSVLIFKLLSFFPWNDISLSEIKDVSDITFKRVNPSDPQPNDVSWENIIRLQLAKNSRCSITYTIKYWYFILHKVQDLIKITW